MANISTIMNNVISKVNQHTKQIISKAASNVLLNQSSLSLDNFAVTKNFAVKTYTGNGTSQSIVTGISSVDFTVSGNGSGYWHDRATGDCVVKNDAGTVVESGSCVVNTSQVHIKSRSYVDYNYEIDGLRGVNNWITTDATNAEASTFAGLSFNGSGFSIGSSQNTASATYVAYQTLYTHIRWGLTNQNKRFLEAYNPVTGDTMIMYEGSGVAGHQIPHSLDRELDFVTIKGLNGSGNEIWVTQTDAENRLTLNNTSANILNDGNYINEFNYDFISIGTSGYVNASGESFILYGKAKSQNWTIDYDGTKIVMTDLDVNGNVARLIEKNTSTTGDWKVIDYVRGNTKQLLLNSSAIETTITADTRVNGTGDGYFNLPADDSVLNITNGKFTSTNGLTDNGYNVALENVTGSIDFADAVNTDEVELIVNGTFDTDLSSWGVNNATWVNGRAYIDATSGSGNITQNILELNKKYQVKLDVEIVSGTMKVQLGTASASSTIISESGTYTLIKDSDGIDGIIYLSRINTGDKFYIDNVSVQEVISDSGMFYVAKQLGGGYQFFQNRPMNDMYAKTSANDNRLVFDKESGKYWTTTGGELVTNGTFVSDTSGWTAISGATLSVVNGQMQVSGGSSAYGAYTTINVEKGKKYKFKHTIQLGTSVGARVVIGTAPSTQDVLYYTGGNQTGSYEVEFVSEIDGVYYLNTINNGTIGTTYAIDNISVYKAEPTLDAPLATPISFLPYPWMVASGTPMYEVIDVEPLADMVVNNFEAESIVVKELSGRFTEADLEYGETLMNGGTSIYGSNVNGVYYRLPDGSMYAHNNGSAIISDPYIFTSSISIDTDKLKIGRWK